MLNCPHCKKTLERLEKVCPRCRTDLGLLLDYNDHLATGLDRAEARVRAGELGEAVWEYLQVLEVDPDNPTARRQVGLVVTAVRQFDREAPGRRWLTKMRGRERRGRWLDSTVRDGNTVRWSVVGLLLLLIGGGALFGFWLGFSIALPRAPEPPPSSVPEQTAPATPRKLDIPRIGPKPNDSLN